MLFWRQVQLRSPRLLSNLPPGKKAILLQILTQCCHLSWLWVFFACLGEFQHPLKQPQLDLSLSSHSDMLAKIKPESLTNTCNNVLLQAWTALVSRKLLAAEFSQYFMSFDCSVLTPSGPALFILFHLWSSNFCCPSQQDQLPICACNSSATCTNCRECIVTEVLSCCSAYELLGSLFFKSIQPWFIFFYN